MSRHGPHLPSLIDARSALTRASRRARRSSASPQRRCSSGVSGVKGGQGRGRRSGAEVHVGEIGGAGVAHLARDRHLGQHLHAHLQRRGAHVVEPGLERDDLVGRDRRVEVEGVQARGHDEAAIVAHRQDAARLVDVHEQLAREHGVAERACPRAAPSGSTRTSSAARRCRRRRSRAPAPPAGSSRSSRCRRRSRAAAWSSSSSASARLDGARHRLAGGAARPPSRRRDGS